MNVAERQVTVGFSVGTLNGCGNADCFIIDSAKVFTLSWPLNLYHIMERYHSAIFFMLNTFEKV